jgi:indolepyruvate ferredoxin oxidoreductase alpha subunit
MCPGCPHRGTYYVLGKLHLRVTGDIGCYTLGALKPNEAMDACLCMGASIGMSHGLEKATGGESARDTVAVIGDSTFVHSGITGLVNAVYNHGRSTVLILDNSITAMTGHQPNPTVGYDIRKQETYKLDIETLCRAVGVRDVKTVDPYELEELESAIKDSLGRDEVSVIIVRRPCALLSKEKKPVYAVNTDKCKGCGMCLKLGCPAIEREGKKARINPALCVGCDLCARMCKFSAIGGPECR